MTLIVARKTGNEIRMHSDAKISYPDQLRNNPLKGALKLIVMNDLCIGYAGNYHAALDAIRKIRELKLFGLDQAIESLFDAHITSKSETDFIIATHRPYLILIRIKEGSVEMDLDSTWIGDPGAFSRYQELYHTTSPIQFKTKNNEQALQLEVEMRMSDALCQLVREGNCKSVGNFTVSVHSSNKGFKYQGNAIAFPIPQNIPPGVTASIKFGTAQQGGYAYSVLCPKQPNVAAIAVHFYQGNIGALYIPLERDEAIVYSDVTFDQFKKLVLRDYGFEIDGIKIS